MEYGNDGWKLFIPVIGPPVFVFFLVVLILGIVIGSQI